MPRYKPPDNDHLSAGFEDIVPAEYKGTDRFLDIVTWNIRYFHDQDRERVKRVVDILDALNADIIVLEEILEGSLDEVASQLADRGAGYYKVAYGTTGGNQRVAMMYDLDWIRAKDEIGELFGKNTVLTAEGKDAFPRLPLRGYFTSLSQVDEPFDLQLVGLHLKSQRGGGADQRLMAAQRLRTWLLHEAPIVDADVVMIGDWNEPPKSETWEPIHQLESENLALFSKVNDNDSISHLMYRNKSHIGSRLDMAAVSAAAFPEMKGKTEVVKWKSLDKLLQSSPKAAEIKAYIREVTHKLTDHMPVVVRFYFEEQS